MQAKLVLHRSDGRPADVFRHGEPITIVLSISNPTSRRMSFTLDTSQQYDFAVNRAGRRGAAELWRWSHGKLFAQVLTGLTFGEGEELRFATTWNQTDNSGTRVAPGRYQAEGLLLVNEPGLRTGRLVFTIEP